MEQNPIIDGLLGLCVGDALGVPVEFKSRDELKRDPVTDMIGNGTHHQPPGTWSDDSSLTFCLAESLCHAIDLHDLAERFCRWNDDGYWAPYGSVFDIGITTREAIFRLKHGIEPIEAGGNDENSNGNGSLMRILPLAYVVRNWKSPDQKYTLTHNVSALTHAHPRSQMACAIYIDMVLHLLQGASPRVAYEAVKRDIPAYYQQKPYSHEFPHFSAILQDNIAEYQEAEIQSSGYVVHTLEASFWCLLNSSSYAETILKAVNLGGDTDTTGAVAGGLAGIYYGAGKIPTSWLEQIARKDDIVNLARRLYAKCYGSLEK
jgi:ADP-ribosylglycohydrolase